MEAVSCSDIPSPLLQDQKNSGLFETYSLLLVTSAKEQHHRSWYVIKRATEVSFYHTPVQ